MRQAAELMQRALDLASMARGRTSPNPLVGAVIEKDGEIIGEGCHLRAGLPHAEVVALRQAGDRARGATLYVTLEPCNHFGRTPPCTEAVIAAGIKKVEIAVLDPNPRVAGEGMARLKEAGIEVRVGLQEQAAREMNECFFKFITKGVPFVVLKTATTLDGRIATRTGDSKWITNEKSRLFVHHLRNIYDGILVGIGTVLKDDPQLNTRLPDQDCHHPVRLIIDGRLDIPRDCQILRTAREQPTIIYTSRGSDPVKAAELVALGAEVVFRGDDPDLLPLEDVLHDAAARGMMSVMIEAGGQINAYALEKRLVDRVYWFVAPRICGGTQAVPAVAGKGAELMAQAIELRSVKISSFDSDLLIEGCIDTEVGS